MTVAVAASRRELTGLQKSLLLHGTLLASLTAWHWWSNRARDSFGDPNSLGNSAGITAVANIPIMRREGRVNPVANDTESQMPTPEKKAEPKERVVRDDPDAIALKMTKKKPQPENVARNRTYREDPILPNQVTSNQGRAAVSELFDVKGAGGVGAGDNSPFGNRFGWYAKLLQERIGQKWRTDDVDSNVRRAPRVIVAFSIARNGTVSNVKVVQSSGVYSLDTSAQRAVFEASPLPPLPDQFEKPSAQVEFQFELSR